MVVREDARRLALAHQRVPSSSPTSRPIVSTSASHRERLLQECRAGSELQCLRRLLVVAGDEDDRQVGVVLADLPGEPAAAEAGHDDVGHDTVDLFAVLFVEHERFGAVVRREHVVARVLQDLLGEVADDLLVLREQDRPRFRLDRRSGDRQVERERGADIDLRIEQYEPAALGDRPVDAREAEAGAFLLLLCREERLERAAARLVVHADAGVGDADDDVRPGMCVQLRRVVLVDRHVRRPHLEEAAARHRVAGVERKVDERVLEQAPVGKRPGARCRW